MEHTITLYPKKDMKKAELLKSYKLDKLDDVTVFIENRYFSFSYTSIQALKTEHREGYRYFGGLQCEYNRETQEYKNLENWLCEIAEKALGLYKEKGIIEISYTSNGKTE